MFYPVESLRRGGRFYLCWVADSWPLRFATITHRQLWSQDIRKICDDLLEVMTNESGRPAKRFSLRLSSQLLRGLVRLYERKVSIFLGDLCMIHANVFKATNKKYHIIEVDEIAEQIRRPQLQQLEVQELLQEQPENEQRAEEMLLQTSGNMVANVQDITLREAAIADVPMPYDGFGEENPEQALQNLQDRTVEMMLVQPDVSSHSARHLALDYTAQSHDQSRDRSRAALDPQMETISELDVTLFRKSAVDAPVPEFEKDLPEIPEIPPPEIPVPGEKKVQEEAERNTSPEVADHPPKKPASVEIELEELEEMEPQPKRRKVKRLIIDKKTILESNYMRPRLENPKVELRCMDPVDDVTFIHVPAETFFRRPCHGGGKLRRNVGFELVRLFTRNLGPVSGQPYAERNIEEAVMQDPDQTLGQPIPNRQDEEQEVLPQVQIDPPSVEMTEIIDVPQQIQHEGPTDITGILEPRRSPTEIATVTNTNRKRSMGYVSYRQSQKSKANDVPVLDMDIDKENIPENIQRGTIQPEGTRPPQDPEIIYSSMLQQVGLADIQLPPPVTEPPMPPPTTSARKTGSEGSETPLGSLDRTKVSLGDSDKTTDSKRFIRDQWGTEGTMLKILRFVKAGQTITVSSLIEKGPVVSGYQRIIAARCFTSILKLKQHGFIYVYKDPETQEITDVTLGPKFDNINA